MAAVTVTVDGVAEVVGALQAYQTRVRDAIVALVTETCEAVERDAKANAPKLSGKLRDSIRADLTRALSDLVGLVATNLFYASYVEFGTKRLSKHPFLFPAWEAHAGRFVDRLRAILAG